MSGFKAVGTRLRMSRGDYGIPLTIHLAAHCKACEDDLLPTDEIRLSVEQGGTKIISRSTTWGSVEADDGRYTITLTKDETKKLHVGLYTWRVKLIRAGLVRHTLVADTLEVIL